MTTRALPASRRSAGFSMVEFFLVALILGVGLLGLAALTAMSVRGFGGSRTRGAASTLAASVLDRLSLDGRMSSTVRSNGGSIPATALVANATDGTVNTYKDPASGLTTFDLQGQPSATAPVYTVSWVRRAPKTGLTPAATSLTANAEVVVNVTWNEAVKNTSGATVASPRYLSVARSIRY